MFVFTSEIKSKPSTVDCVWNDCCLTLYLNVITPANSKSEHKNNSLRRSHFKNIELQSAALYNTQMIVTFHNSNLLSSPLPLTDDLSKLLICLEALSWDAGEDRHWGSESRKSASKGRNYKSSQTLRLGFTRVPIPQNLQMFVGKFHACFLGKFCWE